MAYVLDVKRAVRLKRHSVYPHFARTSVNVPAGSIVECMITIPIGECWLVTHETRGELPYNVFEETCVKDGFQVFPFPVLMGKDNIDYPIYYPVPILVEKTIAFSMKNTDVSDHMYEMSIFYAVMSRAYVKQLRIEDALDEELEKRKRESG